MYTLITNRMHLKLSHPKLAKQVAEFNLRNKNALSDTEPTRPDEFYTAKGQKKYLKLDYKDSMNCTEFRYWLTLKGEEKIIGTVSISSILFGSVKSCFLSYKIDNEYQGKGFATEAVTEIINLAFKTLELHRIEAYIMPSNTKSLRVIEKLGFENEGLSKRCLEVNGVWQDHLRFSLLNE